MAVDLHINTTKVVSNDVFNDHFSIQEKENEILKKTFTHLSVK